MSSSLHVFRGASEFRRMKVRAGTRKVKFAGRSALGIRPGPPTVPQFLGDPTVWVGWLHWLEDKCLHCTGREQATTDCHAHPLSTQELLR